MKDKFAKKKAREERIRKQKHIETLTNLYPSFVFLNEQVVSKELVDAVKNVCDIFKFKEDLMGQSKKFQVYFEILKKIRNKGFCEFVDEFKEKSFANYIGPEADLYLYKSCKIKEKEDDTSLFIHSLILLIGSYIQKKLPQNILEKHMPHEFFRILFLNDKIAVLFYKIHNKKGDFGRIYHLHKSQEILYQNKKYKLCFSGHALGRLIERHFTNDNNYDFLKQDNFYETIHFAKYILNDNDPDNLLIEMHVPIMASPFSKEIFEWLKDASDEELPLFSGCNINERTVIYFRLFYSPVKFENNDAILITNLLPGFKGTPEYDLWKKSHKLTKKEFFKTKSYFYGDGQANNDIKYQNIMKLFHSYGIKQFHRGNFEKDSGKLWAKRASLIADYVDPNDNNHQPNSLRRSCFGL